MRSRAERFDELVMDAATRFEGHWGRPFPAFELGVEDVPPSDPAPWEHEEVPLGRFFASDARREARVVIESYREQYNSVRPHSSLGYRTPHEYRRPIETRAQAPSDLALLVDEVVAEQLAALLGVSPRDLDPGYDGD